MDASNPYASYFNKHLKGKYAYWIQMRYIVSFDHMRHEGYVACEEDINKLLQKEDGTYPKPYGAPSLDVYEPGIICYVDSNETDNINSIINYRLKNKYTADEDVTIEELKKFRNWLASEILAMDQSKIGAQRYMLLNTEETHVLNYYNLGMYDETIKILSEFGRENVEVVDKTVNSCGCGNQNISGLYNIDVTVCDPISIYKNNIYKKMVSIFSDIDFWTRWTPEFILLFKKYIDNIININLPIKTDKVNFTDCTCLQKDPIQENFISTLKKLSISLGYIYESDIIGHKNYITDALKDWSTMFYEDMYWM